MRIAIVIEPNGKQNTIWANLLDCERYIEKQHEFIYRNYDNLPDLLILVPQDVFDYIDEEIYFKLLRICRLKDFDDSACQIAEKCYIFKNTILKKEAKDWYALASFEMLNDKFSRLHHI